MPIDELTSLADRFGSDKGGGVLCAHRYTRIYDAALRAEREKPLRLLEIGLIHGHTQNVCRDRLGEIGCPSLRMWAEYLPAATLFGFDLVDFSALTEPRMTIFQGDQGNRRDLVSMAERAGGAFDIIIDDGSHASHHQQISFAVLFEYLAPGGLYCIEDLHYQPAELELPGISSTREFLGSLRVGRSGARVALEQRDLTRLLEQIHSIHFFDSQSDHWPAEQRADALAVIVKQGTHPLLGDVADRLPDDPGRFHGYELRAGKVAQWSASCLGNAAIDGRRIHLGTAITPLDARESGSCSSDAGGFAGAHGTADPSYLVAMPSGGGPLLPQFNLQPAGYYRLGDEIDFRLGGNAPLYQLRGWDVPSGGGTWTIAPSAQLRLRIVDGPPGESEFSLEILAQGLVGPSHPETRAELLVNGVSLDTRAFAEEELHCLSFRATADSVSEAIVFLEIRPRAPVSPQALGLSDDRRALGLLFGRLRIVLSNRQEGPG